jgi:hypothetical protein
MVQSPSYEANCFSASQVIPPVLWVPKVHYRIHKSPQPVSFLSEVIRVHASLPLVTGVRGGPCGAVRWRVQRTAPQGSPRTSATCIAATTPGLIVRILKFWF